MQDAVTITPNLSIPLAEISFHFSRSGGPGGQHVNRTESKVELRFNVSTSPSLSDFQRSTLLEKLDNQLDRNGVLHLFAEEHRSQFQNRQAVLRRFQELLQQALKPQKKRRPTKPSRAAKERQLSAKKRHSQKKRLRKKPTIDE